MSSLKKWFLFYATIVSIQTSIQMNKLCDRSDTSLVIDSAVAFRQNPFTFWLFSGDIVYESNPIDINTNAKPKFTAKRVKDIHWQLRPPIDMAYRSINYKNETLVSLYNEESHVEWDLADNNQLRLASEWYPNDVHYLDAASYDGPDAGLFFGDRSNLAFHIEIYDGLSREANYGLLELSADEKEVRLLKYDKLSQISTAAKKPQFKGMLKDSLVEGIVTFRDNSNKDWLYLFAGRHLCRFQFDYGGGWTPFCPIEDIADWAECSDQR